MIDLGIKALLWLCAIGCGLIGGVFFAFSTFIMNAFDRVGSAGISAMQSINATILKSLFMPIFLGTTLASGALGLIALFRWGEPGSPALLAGGILYVLGMFACTMLFNVPLNNALDAVQPGSSEGAAVWARYLKDWTFWNHVRTVAALAATALFTYALCA
jgi:uncharacterized membrane protein